MNTNAKLEKEIRNTFANAMPKTTEGIILRKLCTNKHINIAILIDTITTHMPETIPALESLIE